MWPMLGQTSRDSEVPDGLAESGLEGRSGRLGSDVQQPMPAGLPRCFLSSPAIQRSVGDPDRCALAWLMVGVRFFASAALRLRTTAISCAHGWDDCALRSSGRVVAGALDPR